MSSSLSFNNPNLTLTGMVDGRPMSGVRLLSAGSLRPGSAARSRPPSAHLTTPRDSSSRPNSAREMVYGNPSFDMSPRLLTPRSSFEPPSGTERYFKEIAELRTKDKNEVKHVNTEEDAAHLHAELQKLALEQDRGSGS